MDYKNVNLQIADSGGRKPWHRKYVSYGAVSKIKTVGQNQLENPRY